MIVFLDSNILGLIVNRNESFTEAQACRNWFDRLFVRGVRFITSDICNYEVRRGLLADSIRSGKISLGLTGLDTLKADGFLEFVPVSTKVFDLAAELWARASTEGKTTRDEKNIDVDIIISAQYQILRDEFPGRQIIIATTNLKHLSLFCDAANWREIEL